MHIPYAKIIDDGLLYLSQGLWTADETYRWTDDPDAEPVYKTVAELNAMGYWPVELSDPPDTVNQYRPVYSVVDGKLQVAQWQLMPPLFDPAIASSVFVTLAQNGELDPTLIGEHPALFIPWESGLTCKAGTIVQENIGGEIYLYQSMQDVTSGQAHYRPSEAPSLWKRILDPAEEWPDWYLAAGVLDMWMIGSKCTHNGKHWVSKIDYNVYEPGVVAATIWEEVTE